MNLIDGSSVWVQSVSQTLTEIPGVELTLLLRTHEQRDVLTAPLHANPRIELVDPEHFGSAKPLDPESAVHALESLDAERSFDVVLLRGAAICAEAARRHTFQGRLWCYYLTPHEFRPGQEVGSAEADRSGLRAGALPNGSDPRARCCGYPRPGGQARAAATDDPSSLQVSRGAEGSGGLKPRICRQVRPRVLLPGDHRHLPAAAARPPGCRVPSDRRQDPQPA